MYNPADFNKTEWKMNLEVWVAEAYMKSEADVAELNKIKIGDEMFSLLHGIFGRYFFFISKNG